jgi:hypothetical protein
MSSAEDDVHAGAVPENEHEPKLLVEHVPLHVSTVDEPHVQSEGSSPRPWSMR